MALVIHYEAGARRALRRMLESRGYEVVQSSTGMAGLELVQRLPASLRLVAVQIDIPGLQGTVLLEALHLFRPGLPVVCVGEAPARMARARCLRDPFEEADLDLHLRVARSGGPLDGEGWAPEAAVARARDRYALTGDLVEAALELAR